MVKSLRLIETDPILLKAKGGIDISGDAPAAAPRDIAQDDT